MGTKRHTRRRFLTVGSAAVIVGLAGCQGDASDDESTTENGDGDETPANNTTPDDSRETPNRDDTSGETPNGDEEYSLPAGFDGDESEKQQLRDVLEEHDGVEELLTDDNREFTEHGRYVAQQLVSDTYDAEEQRVLITILSDLDELDETDIQMLQTLEANPELVSQENIESAFEATNRGWRELEEHAVFHLRPVWQYGDEFPEELEEFRKKWKDEGYTPIEARAAGHLGQHYHNFDSGEISNGAKPFFWQAVEALEEIDELNENTVSALQDRNRTLQIDYFDSAEEEQPITPYLAGNQWAFIDSEGNRAYDLTKNTLGYQILIDESVDEDYVWNELIPFANEQLQGMPVYDENGEQVDTMDLQTIWADPGRKVQIPDTIESSSELSEVLGDVTEFSFLNAFPLQPVVIGDTTPEYTTNLQLTTREWDSDSIRVGYVNLGAENIFAREDWFERDEVEGEPWTEEEYHKNTLLKGLLAVPTYFEDRPEEQDEYRAALVPDSQFGKRSHYSWWRGNEWDYKGLAAPDYEGLINSEFATKETETTHQENWLKDLDGPVELDENGLRRVDVGEFRE